MLPLHARQKGAAEQPVARGVTLGELLKVPERRRVPRIAWITRGGPSDHEGAGHLVINALSLVNSLSSDQPYLAIR